MERAKSKVIKDKETAIKKSKQKALQEVRSVLQFDKIKIKGLKHGDFKSFFGEIPLGEPQLCSLSEILIR